MRIIGNVREKLGATRIALDVWEIDWSLLDEHARAVYCAGVREHWPEYGMTPVPEEALAASVEHIDGRWVVCTTHFALLIRGRWPDKLKTEENRSLPDHAPLRLYEEGDTWVLEAQVEDHWILLTDDMGEPPLGLLRVEDEYNARMRGEDVD
jgi:hypothetical protein